MKCLGKLALFYKIMLYVTSRKKNVNLPPQLTCKGLSLIRCSAESNHLYTVYLPPSFSTQSFPSLTWYPHLTLTLFLLSSLKYLSYFLLISSPKDPSGSLSSVQTSSPCQLAVMPPCSDFLTVTTVLPSLLNCFKSHIAMQTVSCRRNEKLFVPPIHSKALHMPWSPFLLFVC